MSVGLSSTKAEFDAYAGATVLAMREAHNRARAFKAVLDRVGQAGLLALGYTQAEVDKLTASYAALNDLVSTGDGQRAQPTANNFWWDARELAGPQYPG